MKGLAYSVSQIGAILIMSSFMHINPSIADDLTVESWIDQFVDLCVGAGSSTVTSGNLDANAGITLKSLTLGGALKGEVKLEKSQFRLLTEGINNKMSSVAADQADKVRNCLDPVRRQLLAVMKTQMGGGGGASPVVEILSPDEEKIMKALATTAGMAGQAGQLVSMSSIKSASALGDIRLRVAMRSLQQKLFAGASSNVASLWDAGEQYVLEMGYSN